MSMYLTKKGQYLMELEKRVYSKWAFEENSTKKSKINEQIYEELISKYKVARVSSLSFPKKEALKAYKDYDLVIEGGSGYGRAISFRVVKNTTSLSLDEVALICDKGNLCFGYEVTKDIITVWID